MAKKKHQINYNEATGEFINCSVFRGFPLGGIGSGGLNIGTDGHFTEFRINNNWMNPVRGVRGTFFAVHMQKGAEKVTRILRKGVSGAEYQNIEPIRSTRFHGELPGFDLMIEDDLPAKVKLSGFTPHIPHNIKDSTLPTALFTLTLSNPSNIPVFVSALFSFENILGLGGTGYTGVKKIGKVAYGINSRLTYRDVTGNYQEIKKHAEFSGIDFKTSQKPDKRSHRYSTIGEYCIAADVSQGFSISVCEGWNSLEKNPKILSDFSESGTIFSPHSPVVGGKKCRPAAAIAVSGELGPKETKDIVFAVVWWMPNHVTEKNLIKKTSKHDGVRVGHIYENYFSGPDEIVEYVLKNRDHLRRESFELPQLVDESTLPTWLKRSIKNSIDSTLCNTLVPKEGTMYTIEGMDWPWPYGGLTGTNDQRLSSHPYTSVFFTELDKREIDMFRKLMDERGSIPHGNGNCDISLGDAGVPYGWPDEIMFVLPAKEWTDLTMSEIIQAGKLYRITGDAVWLKKFWPDMKKMTVYLDSISVHGVPEGGTTYDVWDFPGTFIYSATVYVAALKTMMDLALEIEPASIQEFEKRYNECKKRINDSLWDETHGYFRSSPEKDTIFTASLAGDWISRYAGLGPVVEPAKAAQHMALQHKVLIKTSKQKAQEKGKLPSPWAEAKADGTEMALKSLYEKVTNMNKDLDHLIYLWQVLSYQAMEHIYLGQVDLGLDVMKMIYDKINSMGLTWSACLVGYRDSVYMTHPVIWAVFNAISGAALDVPRGILHLSPKILPDQDITKVPVCFPGFWALLSYERLTNKITIEVKKHFGNPIEIKQICVWNLSGEKSLITLEKPQQFTAGACWEGKI